MCSSWICIHMDISLTWLTSFLDIPIACMIKINILQKILESPLPSSHSPSRPRLKHPLLCYTIPQVIHLSFLGIFFIRIVYDNSSSLIVEVSLTLPLLKESLRHVSPQYIILWGWWLMIGFSCHKNSLLPCFPSWRSSFVPWDRYCMSLVSHVYSNPWDTIINSSKISNFLSIDF